MTVGLAFGTEIPRFIQCDETGYENLDGKCLAS